MSVLTGGMSFGADTPCTVNRLPVAVCVIYFQKTARRGWRYQTRRVVGSGSAHPVYTLRLCVVGELESYGAVWGRKPSYVVVFRLITRVTALLLSVEMQAVARSSTLSAPRGLPTLAGNTFRHALSLLMFYSHSSHSWCWMVWGR